MALMFFSNHFIEDNSETFFENKRANRIYNIPVKYDFKSFDYLLLNIHLGPTYFRSYSYLTKKKEKNTLHLK